MTDQHHKAQAETKKVKEQRRGFWQRVCVDVAARPGCLLDQLGDGDSFAWPGTAVHARRERAETGALRLASYNRRYRET